MNTLISIVKFVIDILLPKRCVGCKNLGSYICESCSTALPRAQPPKQHYISSLFDYRNPTIKRSIWRFKYGNIRELADFFGEKLYEEVIGDLGDGLIVSKNEPYLLVPIPLHPRRLRERGYNQSELLCMAMLKHDVVNLFVHAPACLSRIRETKSQAKREARTARIENLRGAFSANSVIVKNKNVILIDDVTTTGATIDEARKILLSSGARSVLVYTIAH